MQACPSLSRCLPADNRNSRPVRPMMRYLQGEGLLHRFKDDNLYGLRVVPESRDKHTISAIEMRI